MKRTFTFLSVATAFCVVTATVITPSCKSSKSTTSTTTAVSVPDKPSYAVHVKPIVDAACGTKCHSPAKKADGLDLSFYEGVKDACEKHKLLASIKHESGVKAMPRMAPQLSKEAIATIEKWINDGYAQ
ncbi:MAG TPA: hypothetical protein PLU85_05895 [Bacteroidia bacterium]|nr:hypothetical protein [Bacteroidia bacterium]QQR95661.1 MAG: hypothetical protein IPJ93_02680 [Bacteroidota bacterium]MBP7714870.1 hypothetical protein [Bacteroidia bacterium]MBP8669588.1 hypothetical protein [Bacteroidia bacterium]HOZ83461.1 hypothetical protein [Bacteroidia bacterium]